MPEYQDNRSGIALLLKRPTSIEDAIALLESRPVEGEMDIPYKYWYYREDGSLITSALGVKVHSPLNENEALREGLDAVFKLAMNTKVNPTDKLAFNLAQVRDLAKVGIGTIKPLELKTIAQYAFSENAMIGNGPLASPACESLTRIVKVFPAFRPG
jgi:hypothetical protein